MEWQSLLLLVAMALGHTIVASKGAEYGGMAAAVRASSVRSECWNVGIGGEISSDGRGGECLIRTWAL